MHLTRFPILVHALIITLVLEGCQEKKDVEQPVFNALDAKRTGLSFTNKLTYTPEFNLFKYMYFYNGSGVGAGDFNNDGLIDLFFGSNQGQNSLYLNTGSLQFKDITKEARIPSDGGWTTGISVVDINNDGWLDVYVCRVGRYETLQSKNQLLINEGLSNTGAPRFTDRAKEYGLDFSGFSTQAAFFDYDNDSDLDMFLLNHSVHHNNNFRPRSLFNGTYDELSGDKIFRNDSQKFVDVTKETGIHSTAISYGLGIAVSDINLDGYPDLYIGNDFHENDYLYINQKNGTFKEEGTQRMMHTSQYSMGVDVADVNNDAYPEIISMDMLPADPYILKRSLGEDNYDLFHEKIGMGYSHQFTRNNLQYNRRNGQFSEIGLYSGIAATDWSWAPLWMDFNNDGLKDLFISNGIPKRMNDIDYINFVSSGEVQQKINANNMQQNDLSLIRKFPEIKLPNKFYTNEGALRFKDIESRIEGNVPTFSNGAVQADLDNDGDLDIVVNNIDSEILLYRNNTSHAAGNAFIQLKFKGPAANTSAIGAKVILYSGEGVRTYENFPVKGFLSSMETPMHIGLTNTKVDSLIVLWPDRTFQNLNLDSNRLQLVKYTEGLPTYNFPLPQQTTTDSIFSASDITSETGLSFMHSENRFVEFDREPLIPHMVSTEGPGVAVGDINNDSLQDLFIGGARNRKSAIFLQQPSGKFLKTTQPALDADSIYENTAASWIDINKDGNLDLVITSGGNEFFGPDFHNTPRVYVNNGKATFTRLPDPFGPVYMTASCIAPVDLNRDGYMDLFIGARAVPWAYGELPKSYLFLNNKNGKFTDVTTRYATELSGAGFVTNALWYDLDQDGDEDLLLSLQWGDIVAFVNDKGRLTRKVLSDKKGWWNFLLPCDVNGDGHIDLIAGNLGENSRLKAAPEQPVRFYFHDFDGNGVREQVISYYVGGKEIPFANKAELEKQLPVLRKKFLKAEDLAKASLTDIFGKEKLAKAQLLKADYFSNALLLNKGDMTFETKALPWEAQLTSFRDAATVDANGDTKPDILLVGNYYDNNIEMGRYDADYGTLLINQGAGRFTSATLKGVLLKGQVRDISPIKIGNNKAYLLARNNDSLKVIRFSNSNQ